MRQPIYDMNVFRDRRRKLAERTKGSAFIVLANPEVARNNDVPYSFRQDTNFFYLTGFEETDSILVFRPGQSPETVLFVRDKDVERETWDGFRYGPEGAEKAFKVDKAYSIEEFDKKIVELLIPVERIYYRWNLQPEFDVRLLKILDNVRLSVQRSGRGNLPVFDSWEAIGELRIIKQDHDIAAMRKACEISSNAHIEAMKFTRPGVNERNIHGVLLGSFLKQGAVREGYNTIVATGAGAVTLHYVFNDQVCRDGELVLVDAGAELDFYTGDITRTYPVNGKFTQVQKRVYEPLLELQKALVKRVKPGIPLRSMQEVCIEGITDILIDLKLLKGSRQQNIESLAYKKYYPHGVSHLWGMDVHDAGLQIVDGKPRILEPGISFTVEPGIYVPANDATAPEELRGIGIRIEDDVVVTQNGCLNLTEGCPKEIADMEAIIGKG